MSSGWHDLMLFFGRFHLLVVHLPIGGLVLLGMMELLARAARFKEAAHGRGLILGFATAGAIVAAVCGLILAQAGGYEPQLLAWHKWTGLGVAVACTVAWVLHWLGHPRSYRLVLLVTLAGLVVAGHYGASITHGRDFLSRYLPAPLRGLFGGGTLATVPTPAVSGPLPQRVFAEVVQPILAQRCGSCHGPEKPKGGLRVDSLEALLKGGSDGPVVVPGKPGESPLIKRLLLPLNDEDHMPPEGKPQPTPAEITTLQWWVEWENPEVK
jgi:hypothetical protein